MLAKSGLLQITLKTADLLRSNQQAQRQLELLKVVPWKGWVTRGFFLGGGD